MLGWYENSEDLENEIKAITEAINNGESGYSLKYAADVEYVGIFGQPRIKRESDK